MKDPGLSGRCLYHGRDESGELVAYVGLGRKGEKGHAILYEEDLDLLLSLGLSLRWNRLSKGGTITCPASQTSVQVARVLLDAGPGQNIHYRNGDPTDLRRRNLAINEAGFATRRDRDLLTPLNRKKNWGMQQPILHYYENREEYDVRPSSD